MHIDFQDRKMKFSKFKFSSYRSSGKHDKESTSSLIKETDVNEEYKKAFRTQSYTDIYNQVQTHIRYDRGSSSFSIHDHYVRLCDILLEPQSETIANLDKTFNLHHLLLEFFKAGVEAWKICEDLLESIHQINTNYRKVEQIINLAQRVPNGKQCPILYEELASYSSLMNPLSGFGPEKFPKVHTNHKLLLKRLTTKHIRIKRKDKIIRIVKKSGGCALVGLYIILAVTLLVLACHGLVVAAASPVLIACSLGLVKKGSSEKKGAKMSELKWVVMQLDVAAKGVYTMIKDLDTMGWLVGRLHNDVEFGRTMAQKCIKNRNPDVLEEVVREFNVHGRCFLEQLEELEDHIYLCLLNVNRTEDAFWSNWKNSKIIFTCVCLTLIDQGDSW